MTITTEKRGSAAYISLVGRLGVDTAAEFRRAMDGLEADINEIVFDAQELQYISSSGLRELLILKKRLGDRKIRMLNAQKSIIDVFTATGFDRFIEISPAAPDYLRGREFYSFKTMLRVKAEERGDCPVVWNGDRTVTWRELDRYSQIIAADLAAMGAKKGSHVAICGKNSLNWVLTFFAIQKLGAIAMLLNVQLRPAEINTLTEIGDIEFFCHGEIPMMETDGDYLDKIRSGGIRACYDFGSYIDFSARAAEYPEIADCFDYVVEADEPCVFLFTSGSTGTPKGILHSAYGLLNSAYALAHRLRMTPEDRSYLVLPLYHILGFMDSFIVVLISDGMVYIAPDTRTNSMLRIISAHRCTVLHCVPTLILALIRNERFADYDLSSLRVSMLGGAPMAPTQMAAVRKALPANHFISGYGLSEMAPACSTEYGDTEEHILGSIGRPLPCSEVMVQNPETGEPCGIGERGELLLRGINLMLCYYRLDIDKQSIDGNGWLHTGDLVSRDAEGYLHFEGRLKELIIRGGENIMPNEVAAALVRHEKLNDVKVFGIPHPVLGEEVVACVIPKEGENPDSEELKAFLGDKLAAFKIPARFVCYKEFPLLANGKIDGLTLRDDMLKRIA